MKTTDYLQLGSVQNTVGELQTLLASFQLYYANLRGFHWNVKGVAFFQLHAKYEEFYDDAAEKVDEVAERILMLGGTPAHNFSDYLQKSLIKESGVVSDGKEIANLLLDYLKTLLAQERKVLAAASENNDEGTVALLSNFISEQEKTVWMLVSSLS
ncbi:MAG: DNA starvation/stationary phase protection protein [Dysgonamonadaceae bacterium]|jgi:starvation-inducible DNA-binding protein|nr:DNA starvation/stationary phase protection protein [Dysgonamonadaceae bacterium]